MSLILSAIYAARRRNNAFFEPWMRSVIGQLQNPSRKSSAEEQATYRVYTRIVRNSDADAYSYQTSSYESTHNESYLYVDAGHKINGYDDNDKTTTIMANTLAVVSQSGESLTFYNIESGEKTGHISDLKGEPHELCYDERTNLLYVTHAYAHGWYMEHGENGHEISIIDCTAREEVDTIDISPYGGPHYIVLDKKRNILYCSVEAGIGEEGPGGIVAIDLHNMKVIQAIPSGAKTHWFVMTPDGRKAYTCNKEAGFVSVLDLHQGKLLAKINLPGRSGCEQPGISNDGQYAYFPIPSLKATTGDSLKGTSTIVVIDTKSDTISITIPLSYMGWTIHVDTQDRLLVGQLRFNEDRKHLPGKLTILSSPANDFKHLATLDTDIAPLTLTSTSDAKRAFAANIFSGTVTVLDMEKLEVERTIEVDLARRVGKKMLQGAHGLAVLP